MILFYSILFAVLIQSFTVYVKKCIYVTLQRNVQISTPVTASFCVPVTSLLEHV